MRSAATPAHGVVMSIRGHERLCARRLIARIVDEIVIGLLMVPWLLAAAAVGGLGQIAADGERHEVTVTVTAIIGAGVVVGASYEVWTLLITGGVGKWAAGLRVVAADRPTPLRARQALARWLLLVGPTPLAWLTLGADGTGSEDHRALVKSLLVLTLLWRTTIGLSVLASAGRGGLHDRIARSRVVRAIPV